MRWQLVQDGEAWRVQWMMQRCGRAGQEQKQKGMRERHERTHTQSMIDPRSNGLVVELREKHFCSKLGRTLVKRDEAQLLVLFHSSRRSS